MKPSTIKKVTLNPDQVTISIKFPFTTHLISEIKKISGRKLNKEKKIWTAPLCIESLLKLEKLGFIFEEKIQNFLNNTAQPIPIKKTIKIPGLGGTLRGYQNEGVQFFRNQINKGAICGDDMGLGKTIQVLAYLQLNPSLRPAVIICPSPLKINWVKEINIWLKSRKKTMIISGKWKENNPELPPNDIYIINYGITSIVNTCPICKGKKKIEKESNGEGCFIKCTTCKSTGKIVKCRKDLLNINPKIIIWDEIHKLGKEKSQRTLSSMELSKTTPHKIGLTGTPMENSHKDIYWPVKIINPTIFPSFFRFAQKYCDAKQTPFGWDFNGSSNGTELNKILKSQILIRRLKKDVAKDIPPKTRAVIPIQIKNLRNYKRAENDFLKWIWSQWETMGYDKIRKLTREQRHHIIINKNEQGKLALAKLRILRQLAIDGKIDSCITWIKDFIENGEKLILFAHHKKVINLITTNLNKVCVKIDGSCTSKQKEKAKNTFQKDPKCRLIIGSEAMREGFTLTASSNVGFLELWWKPSWHYQAEDRAHRIGQTLPVTIYYLLADQTIELDIAQMLDYKQEIISGTMDKVSLSKEQMIYDLFLKCKEKEERK